MAGKPNSTVSEEFMRRKDADAERRREEMIRHAKGFAYYAGSHWLKKAPAVSRTGTGGSISFRALPTNYNPAASDVRVVDNYITTFTQRAVASTNPLDLPVDVRPRAHDVSSDTLAIANTSRFVLDTLRGDWRCLAAAQRANLIAGIVGSCVIVIDLTRHILDVGGSEVADWRMCWKTCPSTDLILDPANDSQNLREHDDIMVRRVLTLRRARELYDIRVKEDDARPIGELVPEYAEAHRASQGAIYGEYVRNSRTKGVEVYQWHKREGGYGRYGVMRIMYVDPVSGEPVQINNGSEESPFGWDGLPLGLINYLPRTGSPFGQGLTYQMISDQDRINLHATQFTRAAQHSANPMWLIDKSSMSKEEAKEQFTNRVGGFSMWNSGGRNQGYHAPTPVRAADPSPIHADMMGALPDRMRSKIHVSELNLGIQKSHVPDVTTDRLLRESDRVPNMIVESMAEVFADMYRVSLGTVRNGLDEGSPAMLNTLLENKFSEYDLVVFKRLDARTIPLDVEVPRESLRPRSPYERRMQILEGASMPVPLTTSSQTRKALAEDAQMPLTEMDRRALSYAESAVERIITGQTYDPIPYADHDLIIDKFREALYTRGRTDQQAVQRLTQAIRAQMRLKNEELQEARRVTEGETEVSPQIPESGGLDISALAG